MADSKVELLVAGERYGGWKSIRIVRSIESLAGTFAVETSDRWDGASDPWAITEGTPVRVLIDDQTVIDGYVGKREPGGNKSSRRLAISGRDRAAALVDNSAMLAKWTYRNVTIESFVAELAKPFGVRVTVQPGLVLAPIPKIVVTPGDTVYEAIKKPAAEAGVLLVSDAAGGLAITRASAARATALVEGFNLLDVQGSYDIDDRYYRYVVLAQTSATDEAAGEATRVLAEAIDEGCPLKDRVLVIRADRGYTVAEARRRADWEARVRAAKADSVTGIVQGWKQPGGELWRPNTVSYVKSPRLAGVDGDLLITQVEHTISDDAGKTTQLRLMRPDAFSPEPQKAVVKSSGGAWKELAKGAL